MVIILQPEDDATGDTRINQFLATRGMKVREEDKDNRYDRRF